MAINRHRQLLMPTKWFQTWILLSLYSLSINSFKDKTLIRRPRWLRQPRDNKAKGRCRGTNSKIWRVIIIAHRGAMQLVLTAVFTMIVIPIKRRDNQIKDNLQMQELPNNLHLLKSMEASSPFNWTNHRSVDPVPIWLINLKRLSTRSHRISLSTIPTTSKSSTRSHLPSVLKSSALVISQTMRRTRSSTSPKYTTLERVSKRFRLRDLLKIRCLQKMAAATEIHLKIEIIHKMRSMIQTVDMMIQREIIGWSWRII